MSLRTRVTRTMGVLALTIGILFFSASAASAAPGPYPPTSGPTVIIDTGILLPGQSITLTFTGFLPNETITVIIYSDPVNLGSFAANSSGTAVVSVTLPANLEPGAHTIVGTGGSSGRTASLGFTIPSGVAFTGAGSGGGSSGGSGLAFTGIAVGGSLILAVALLTAGTMTLLAGRRKNSMN